MAGETRIIAPHSFWDCFFLQYFFAKYIYKPLQNYVCVYLYLPFQLERLISTEVVLPLESIRVES